MKNLVRGGAILSLLSLLVVFVYAQTKTVDPLINAKGSQTKTENNIAKNNLVKKDDDKKLIKKTGSSKGITAGAGKGSFSASAYCFSGRTAMGHPVRRGLIAADPRVLKLGSKVYLSAGPWSGTYTVSDTGGAIKGKRIDIWVPGCSEARKFGRRTVQVFAAQ